MTAETRAAAVGLGQATAPPLMLPSRREMERAFLGRDAAYDGVFLTAVKTTGIFCRPSCRARKPRPENVEFFARSREAVFAGYRPCRRCHPLDPPGAAPEWARKLLALVEERPDRRLRDADLSRLGLDPARVRRHFKRSYGMTFQAFARGRRLSGAFAELRTAAALDDVALGTGYESHSGFRDAFARAFGGPPGRSRTAEAVVVSWMETPLGPMVAGATEAGLCLLEFTDRRMLETQLAVLRRRFGGALTPGVHSHLDRLRGELARYFAGDLQRFTVPLVVRGTPFEERVWRALLEIPYGETRSYLDLARAVGTPDGARAVGGANGRNRIAVVIPCHRVVNTGGTLGGYGGGLWRKQRLLDLERGARELPLNMAAMTAGRPS